MLIYINNSNLTNGHIHMTEDLAYQSSTGNVVGYVEYDNGDLNKLSACNKIASHMLAVLVRGRPRIMIL